MTILLVDDSDLIRERLRKSVLQLPFNPVVLEAGSQSETFNILKKEKPDLIILDIALPDGSGINILEYLTNKNIKTNIIVFTNYPFPQIERKCRELGAEYFYSKSTDFESVVTLINKIAGKCNIPEDTSNTHVVKKILVVDDSPTIRRMVITSLKNINCPVQFEQAGSGLETIEKLALFKIDLVILDLNMPDMHGMEVLGFMRKHQVYKDIPVVILTTKGDEATRKEALAAGANVFMSKPFSPDDLAEKVKSQL